MPWWQIVLIALAAYCILLLICSLISFQGALRRRRPRKKHAPNRALAQPPAHPSAGDGLVLLPAL